MAARGDRTGFGQLASGALGEEPGLARAVLLEEAEALLPGSEAVALQRAVDRAGGHDEAPHPELVADALRAPAGLRQGLGHDAPFDLGIERRRPPRAPLAPLRVKAVGPVAPEAPLEPVVVRASDAGFPAGCADVAELLGTPEETKPLSVYLVLEGHRSHSRVLVWKQERRRGAPMALISLASEVSTPLRHSSY